MNGCTITFYGQTEACMDVRREGGICWDLYLNLVFEGIIIKLKLL